MGNTLKTKRVEADRGEDIKRCQVLISKMEMNLKRVIDKEKSEDKSCLELERRESVLERNLASVRMSLHEAEARREKASMRKEALENKLEKMRTKLEELMSVKNGSN